MKFYEARAILVMVSKWLHNEKTLEKMLEQEEISNVSTLRESPRVRQSSEYEKQNEKPVPQNILAMTLNATKNICSSVVECIREGIARDILQMKETRNSSVLAPIYDRSGISSPSRPSSHTQTQRRVEFSLT